MSIPTPPAHGATGWDTWLVSALQSLDTSISQNSTTIGQNTTNLTALINTMNSLLSAVQQLQSQQGNGSTAVWG